MMKIGSLAADSIWKPYVRKVKIVTRDPEG